MSTIERDECANCKGALGDLADGREPDELCDTCYSHSQEPTPAPDKALMPDAAVGDWAERILAETIWPDQPLEESLEWLRRRVAQGSRGVLPFSLALTALQRARTEEPEKGAAGDGYQAAFYHLAKLLGIPAKPQSPQSVWINDMLPRLQQLLAATNAGQVEALREAVKEGLICVNADISTREFELAEDECDAPEDDYVLKVFKERRAKMIAALSPKPASTDTDEGNGK